MLESASKEAQYQQKVLELQNELRQAKASLVSAQTENDRLSAIALEMREVIVKIVNINLRAAMGCFFKCSFEC